MRTVEVMEEIHHNLAWEDQGEAMVLLCHRMIMGVKGEGSVPRHHKMVWAKEEDMGLHHHKTRIPIMPSMVQQQEAMVDHQTSNTTTRAVHIPLNHNANTRAILPALLLQGGNILMVLMVAINTITDRHKIAAQRVVPALDVPYLRRQITPVSTLVPDHSNILPGHLLLPSKCLTVLKDQDVAHLYNMEVVGMVVVIREAPRPRRMLPGVRHPWN